ncbi:hypothetical protein [Halovivax gelatinilyticus]|uniref:hypothetical protein n=1 Tax=Halovivax gelatinilyticus TaxID=2961597 RepID=UPI0020CA353A|nr:hypothetical protein [Halovivax gelatinilyticus]
MARLERSFRGISERLAVRYLENLGGEVIAGGDERPDGAVVCGPYWTATIESETVEIGPTLRVTEVTVAFEGPDDTIDDLVAAFAQKAMRAGG